MEKKKPIKFSFTGALNGGLRFTAIMLILTFLLGMAFEIPIDLKTITVNNLFYWMFLLWAMYADGKRWAHIENIQNGIEVGKERDKKDN